MNKHDELEKAIKNLESQRVILGDETVDAAITGIELQLAALKPPLHLQPQRKQITVLFSDLSDFTAITEIADPEEISTVMSAYFATVTPPITKYGGVIEKFIGDAIMAVFGLPQAREDDPENAVRAALEMQQALAQANSQLEKMYRFRLQMRIGINTGLVLATMLSKEERDFTVVGNTVNIANRLETAAPLNEILISNDTYRHVRSAFDVTPQELLRVKGKTKPLQTYLVNQVKRHPSRHQMRGIEGVDVRMVGRGDEFKKLQNAWQVALDIPKTTLITIIGEAGVGKSRFLYEFEQWLDFQPEIITIFRGRSAEQTQGAPHFLLRDLLMAHFNIRESDPIADVRQKFEVGISNTLIGEAIMKAHILGQWLGYDFSNSPHVMKIGGDAEQLKNRGLLYLSQYWVKLAEKRPLLLLLEDIHWADTSSLDALLDILRRQPTLPFVIISLTRPSLFEHRPAWRKLGQDERPEIANVQFKEPAYCFITLNSLSTTAYRELLAEILQKVDTIPEKLFDLVASRAEGNPFYIEEMVNMLIENKVLMTVDETWRVDMTQLIEDQIPSTLTGVLQARLDRLVPDAKETLQCASVVGRVFWDAIVKILGDDQHQVQLCSLQTRDLIYQRNETAFAGTVEYFFKHDLLRDVAYQTVLKKARFSYHRQVAAWLAAAAEQNGRSDEYAAVIGEHYQAAGQVELAAIWYGRAGKQAANNFAHGEAIRYLSLALKFALQEDYETRFALLEKREQTYNMLGNREALRQDIEQLVVLASRLGLIEQAKSVLRQAQQAYYDAEYIQTISYAQAAIELGQDASQTAIVSEGYSVWGWAAFRQGSYARAQELLQMGLQLANDQKQVADCLHGLGLVANNQRKYAIAKSYYKKSLTTRRELGNRRGEAVCLSDLGFMNWNHGRYADARRYYEQSLTIRRELGYRFGEGESLFNLGSVASSLEEYANAKVYLDRSLRIFREVGNQIVEGLALHELGALAFVQTDFQLAESYFQQALAIRQELKLPRYFVEDWAGMAKLKLAQGDSEGARPYSGQILEYLRENPRLYGAENPMRTFRLTWEALNALGQYTKANEVLALAAQIMQDYLDENSDLTEQTVYLNQPHHHVLWAAWAKGC